MIDIMRLDESEPLALYHRYPSQTQRQGAYIELDPSECSMSADWDGEIGGGVPMAVWHCQILRYSIEPMLPGDANNLMADEDVQRLAQTICDGHSIGWDGSNHVGRLTPAAVDAHSDLAQILGDESRRLADDLVVYEMGDWLWRGYTTPEWYATDGDEAEMLRGAEEDIADAASEGVYLDGDAADLLGAVRDMGWIGERNHGNSGPDGR